MNKRTYIYVAVGVAVVVALVIAGIILTSNNKKNADNKSTESSQTSSTQTQDSTKPIKSGDVTTPTDNGELIEALNDDASSMDTDLKNYENDDYSDTNLADSSLYK